MADGEGEADEGKRPSGQRAGLRSKQQCPRKLTTRAALPGGDAGGSRPD